MTAGNSTAIWYEAWNSRDAGAILALYGDTLEFMSPGVRALGLSETATLTCKVDFAQYLERALPRVPNLRFEPIADCVGVRGHTLVYRNQAGAVVAETHRHDAKGLIVHAEAAYCGPIA